MYIKSINYKNLRRNFFESIHLIRRLQPLWVDVEEELEYKVENKSGASDAMHNAADKMKADAKAKGKEITDSDRDLEAQYNVEKAKEKFD
jgi:hypothetical protein